MNQQRIVQVISALYFAANGHGHGHYWLRALGLIFGKCSKVKKCSKVVATVISRFILRLACGAAGGM